MRRALRSAGLAAMLAVGLAVGVNGPAWAALSWVTGYACNLSPIRYADFSVRRDVIGTSVKAYQLRLDSTNASVFWGEMYERRGSVITHVGEFYGPMYEGWISPATRLAYLHEGKPRYAGVEFWATGLHCGPVWVLIRGSG